MGGMLQRAWVTLFVAAPLAAPAQAVTGAEETRLDTVEVAHLVFPEAVARELDASGGWLPVYLELRCRGDRPELVTVDGRVEYGEGRPPFATRTRFEVAPGAPRRAWIYLRAHPGVQGQDARISVMARGKTIRTGDRWTLNSYAHEFDMFPALFVVGGEETDQRPWYGALPTGRGGGKIRSDALQWFEPHQLPDRSIGYQTADVVILRGLDETRLEPGQIEAIREFVFLGGFVVLVPATRDASLFQGKLAGEFLGDALGDLEVEQGFRPRSLYSSDEGETILRGQEVRQGRRWPRPLAIQAVVKEEELELAEELTYTRVEVFAEQTELLRGLWSHPEEELPSREILVSEGSLLYGEVAFGEGRVGVFTINDQAFSVRESGGLRRELWLRAIEPALAGAASSLWRRETARFVKPGLVNSALKDTERDIGTFLIGAMVIGYLVLVGPGTYFYLRRRNRLPAIIWVEPLVIIVSVGMIFSLGYFTKGLLTKVRLTTLISKEEGSPLAFRETYMAIFSADDAEYRIESPRGELLVPLFANEEEAQALRFDRRLAADVGASGGARLMLSGYHLNLWQQGYALNLGVEDAGVGVTIRESPADGNASTDAPRVAITNHLPYEIIAGEVVHRVGRRRLPEPIPSGGTLTVDFSTPVPRRSVEDGEEDEEEDPADTLDRLRPYSLGASRSGSRNLVFWGLVDRGDEDIRLDRAYSLADRRDYFLLYR